MGTHRLLFQGAAFPDRVGQAQGALASGHALDRDWFDCFGFYFRFGSKGISVEPTPCLSVRPLAVHAWLLNGCTAQTASISLPNLGKP